MYVPVNVQQPPADGDYYYIAHPWSLLVLFIIGLLMYWLWRSYRHWTCPSCGYKHRPSEAKEIDPNRWED